MANYLQRAIKSILIAFIFLMPISFSTLFMGTFDTTKLIVLVSIVVLFLVSLTIEVFSQKKIDFKFSNLDLVLLLLVVSFILSGVFMTPNKMDAFLFPGVVTSIIATFLSYLFIKKEFGHDKEKLVHILVLSALTTALVSILSYLGMFAKIPQLPQFMKEVSFSLVGGKLPEAIFLATILPLGIHLTLQEKELSRKVFYALGSFIMVLAITLGILLMLPGKPTSPVLAGWQTSWLVAVDTIKGSPILGAGPGNYLSAFSTHLPISHNSTEIWAIRFSSAGSFLFTLMTEVGLLGVISLVILTILVIRNIVKNFKGDLNDPNLLSVFASISTLISLVCLFIFPANIVLIFLFFTLLIFNAHDHEFNLKVHNLFAIIPLVLASALLFFSVTGLSAERKYKLATDSIIRNDGKAAYDNLRSAINTNPYIDRYHSTYAQINLALARGLAQKTELTDEEKDTVAQLIQQAIKESKAAVGLNPQKSGNWELLARVYQTIMPFAEGADNFAIETFTQAIVLDPLNPSLRIAQGGVYYALERYDEAIKSFEMAIVAKPDLANTHYNLSAAYRQKGDFEKAISEMKTVLTLVQPGSQDHILAETELTNLEKNRTNTNQTGTQNLVPPTQSSTETSLEGIELTNEENPPILP